MLNKGINYQFDYIEVYGRKYILQYPIKGALLINEVSDDPIYIFKPDNFANYIPYFVAATINELQEHLNNSIEKIIDFCVYNSNRLNYDKFLKENIGEQTFNEIYYNRLKQVDRKLIKEGMIKQSYDT